MRSKVQEGEKNEVGEKKYEVKCEGRIGVRMGGGEEEEEARKSK